MADSLFRCFRTRRGLVACVAALICGLMYLVPPFDDPAIWGEGPHYRLIGRPPASINQSIAPMGINWAVLQGQWLIVCLAAGIWLLWADRRIWLATLERVVLAAGSGAAILRVLYPPVFGDGPFGSQGTGFLLHHPAGEGILVQQLDAELAVVFLATGILFVAVLTAGQLVRHRRAPIGDRD